MKKSIYRLKQASHQWYIKFHDVTGSFDFIENNMDQCIYLNVYGRKYIILILYVDDILLIESNLGLLKEKKLFLSHRDEGYG